MKQRGPQIQDCEKKRDYEMHKKKERDYIVQLLRKVENSEEGNNTIQLMNNFQVKQGGEQRGE